MGLLEAFVLAMGIFWGLNELGSQIRKGLLEAAKESKQHRKNSSEDA